MSERVTFEAWATEKWASLCVEDEKDLHHDQKKAARLAEYYGGKPVRVRVTVEIIEPGGEDGA